MAEINKILDLTSEQIAKLTREAFAALLERIKNGEDARDAISAIMRDFDPAYREVLAASFSDALGRFVGSTELRSYPIGDVALSQKLYNHASETSSAVRRIVQEHAAGWQDANKLALQIYEGYGFQQGNDPLQWPARSPKWPKYMKIAVTTDPASFDGWLRTAKRMAGNLKTPQLKAAYLEALDAVEKGAGQKLLERKLDVAFQEQMRFRANRIAQTELHRQWMDDQAREIMADETISVVQFKLAGSHPKTDICDLFANQDKFGLGPGMYPKAKAPKPPLHPFCRCSWHSKRLLSADKARENPASERQYLSKLMKSDGVAEAARIVGSRAKLAAALTNAPFDEVFNIHRPAPYRLGRMADTMPVMDTRDELTQQYFNGKDISISGTLRDRIVPGLLTREDLPLLLGSPDGGQVFIKEYANRIEMELLHPLLSQPRSMELGRDGVLHWNGFFLRDDAPDGIGTRMAAITLQTASTLGMPEAQVMAWGPPYFNGHYTWARLGFDATFSPSEQARIARAGFLEEKSVSSLISTDAGKAWWKDHGWNIEMAFDLDMDSQSMKTLKRYLTVKGVKL